MQNLIILIYISTIVGATDIEEAANKFPSVSDGDGMFTSSADLEGLLWTEADLVDKLEDYVKDEYRRIQKLEKILEEYRSVRDRASLSSEKFIGNPINSFLLIKKLTSDWKELKGVIQGDSERFLKNLTTENYGLRWPKDEDLNGAAIGK